MTFHVEDDIDTLTAEELADRLPLVASNVRVALERRDLLGSGLGAVRQLAKIAARSEAFFVTWGHERHREKAKPL